MSSGEEDGFFYGSGGAEDDAGTPPPPPSPKGYANFGLLELGIFLAIWIVMILGFRYYSRAQRDARKRERKGWFGPNVEAALYEELLERGEENAEVLKKALFRRTMTDVRRLLKLQEDRDSIMALGRSGAISELVLADFKAAEKELELEIFDVQAEAETFRAGWSQEIIRDAARMLKVEDEMAEARRAKEREERRKEREAAEAARERAEAAAAAAAAEEERQALLAEFEASPSLLDEGHSPSSLGKMAAARKRLLTVSPQ